MQPTYSIEELARTTDDVAVRRRFDRRNLFWALLMLLFFGAVSIVLLGTSFHRADSRLDVILALVNFVVIAVSALIFRDAWRADRGLTAGNWRAGRWVRRHLSATLISWMALQYALILTLVRDSEWVPWVMMFPYFLIGIRMNPAELVLIHVFFTAGAMTMTLLGFAKPDDAFGITIGAFIQNAVVLAITLIVSRRLRREVTSDLTERRSQAREQIRMRDELALARDLQLSMLPECAPRLEWVDLCAVSIPATEVGGDYYDYFIEGDRVAVVCGDVAGHGMASGIAISALRSGFTLLRDSLHDPAAVLRRLHDLVSETSRRRMLVTVSVVLLDHARRRATIASAGHPPVILRRANGLVEMIDLFAPPLGVRLPVSIPQRHLDVEPGDIFVLHSDGIYETRNASDESYGFERLLHVVRVHDGDAETLRDAIIADVDRFRGDVEQADDVTVVVARVA